MPPRGRNLVALALAGFLCALTNRVVAQEASYPVIPSVLPAGYVAQPEAVPSIEPPAPAVDPLTDLMRRVKDLEGEAKKAKEKQSTAAKKP